MVSMSELYLKLQTVRLESYPIEVGKVTQHIAGYAILDVISNELVRMGGNAPYLPAGGKAACDEIVLTGLIGAPLLYISSEKQKMHIIKN